MQSALQKVSDSLYNFTMFGFGTNKQLEVRLKQLEEQQAEERASYRLLFDTESLPSSIPEIPVNSETALNCPPVLCAIQTLSQDLANLPKDVFQRQADGSKIKTEGKAQYLLHDRPSTGLVSSNVAFWQIFWAHVFVYGEGFCYINRTQGGELIDLMLIHPQRVKVNTNTMKYIVDNKVNEPIDPINMMRVQWYTDDGISAQSPIQRGKDVIALAIALDRYGCSLVKNGARINGYIKTTTTQPKQLELIQKNWAVRNGGIDNAFRTPILPGDTEYIKLAQTAEELQYAETRSGIYVSVAQLFGLPVSKLKDLGRSTWNNLTEENLAYMQHTLRHWTKLLEDEFNKLWLFDPRFYGEHNFKDFLKADPETQGKLYVNALANQPWLTVDEVRAMENYPPMEEEAAEDITEKQTEDDDDSQEDS